MKFITPFQFSEDDEVSPLTRPNDSVDITSLHIPIYVLTEDVNGVVVAGKQLAAAATGYRQDSQSCRFSP